MLRILRPEVSQSLNRNRCKFKCQEKAGLAHTEPAQNETITVFHTVLASAGN
jgi:hypothetical protein